MITNFKGFLYSQAWSYCSLILSSYVSAFLAPAHPASTKTLWATVVCTHRPGLRGHNPQRGSSGPVLSCDRAQLVSLLSSCRTCPLGAPVAYWIIAAHSSIKYAHSCPRKHSPEIKPLLWTASPSFKTYKCLLADTPPPQRHPLREGLVKLLKKWIKSVYSTWRFPCSVLWLEAIRDVWACVCVWVCRGWECKSRVSRPALSPGCVPNNCSLYPTVHLNSKPAASDVLLRSTVVAHGVVTLVFFSPHAPAFLSIFFCERERRLPDTKICTVPNICTVTFFHSITIMTKQSLTGKSHTLKIM